ncbi:hypothetical protein BGW36DRAFT_383429, partial [Talaromyces proteolyticus]
MSTEPHHNRTFGKLFHHEHRDEQGGKPGVAEGASDTKAPKKESEIHKLEGDLKKEEAKFKNYMQKDEQLEEEGKTYGGL